MPAQPLLCGSGVIYGSAARKWQALWSLGLALASAFGTVGGSALEIPPALHQRIAGAGHFTRLLADHFGRHREAPGDGLRPQGTRPWDQFF